MSVSAYIQIKLRCLLDPYPGAEIGLSIWKKRSILTFSKSSLTLLFFSREKNTTGNYLTVLRCLKDTEREKTISYISLHDCGTSNLRIRKHIFGLILIHKNKWGFATHDFTNSHDISITLTVIDTRPESMIPFPVCPSAARTGPPGLGIGSRLENKIKVFVETIRQ